MKKMLLSLLVVVPTVAFGVIGTEGKGGGSDAWSKIINDDVLLAVNKIKLQDIQPQGKSLAQDLAKAYAGKFSTKLKPEQAKALANVTETLITKIQDKGGLLAILKERFGDRVDLTEKVGKLGQGRTLGAILDLQGKGTEATPSLDLEKKEELLKLVSPALKVIHAQLGILPTDLSATELTNIILPSARAVLDQKILEIQGKKQTGTPAPVSASSSN